MLWSNGRRRIGKAECSTKPRRSEEKTKAEKRLQKRIESYNSTMRHATHKPTGPETKGYHRPGSLKK